MRTEIYQWIKNLAFFHVLTTAVLHILPDKRYEQHIRLFMGLLLILLICTPVFAIVGKSSQFLDGFQKYYGEKEKERMETEAEGIRKLFSGRLIGKNWKNRSERFFQMQGSCRKKYPKWKLRSLP